MQYSIYYLVPENNKAPLLITLDTLNESACVYTITDEHWFFSENVENVQLFDLKRKLEKALEKKQTLDGFRQELEAFYSQKKWQVQFLRKLLLDNAKRKYPYLSIQASLTPKEDSYYRSLLQNLNLVGFSVGLNKISDPKIYFESDDAFKPYSVEPEKSTDTSKKITFPLEVEDLFIQIKDTEGLLELFTDYNYQLELVSYLKQFHRKEIVEFIGSKEEETLTERTAEYIYHELMPEKNQMIFVGLNQIAEEAMLEVLGDNKLDVAEEIEENVELPTEVLFEKLMKHEYFEEFKEDYEFEVERILYDKHQDKVEAFLKLSFPKLVDADLNELVFEELIFDYWKDIFDEKSIIITNAMKQVISENLEGIQALLD